MVIRTRKHSCGIEVAVDRHSFDRGKPMGCVKLTPRHNVCGSIKDFGSVGIGLVVLVIDTTPEPDRLKLFSETRMLDPGYETIELNGSNNNLVTNSLKLGIALGNSIESTPGGIPNRETKVSIDGGGCKNGLINKLQIDTKKPAGTGIALGKSRLIGTVNAKTTSSSTLGS